MTIRTTWYTMDNKSGVEINVPETIAVTTVPEIPGARASVGDTVQGPDGTRWMFVQASATVTSDLLVAISHTGKAAVLTSDHCAANIYAIGIAQFSVTAAATSQYFWAAIDGKHGLSVNAYGTCAAGVRLYIDDTYDGVITSTATTSSVYGLICVSALATATVLTPVEVMVVGAIHSSA